MLAVRLEMTTRVPATGSRLGECTCYAERCGPTHGARTAIADFTAWAIPQRIREAELWLGRAPGTIPPWLQTDDGEQSCWTPCGKTRRTFGRGRPRPIRPHATVSWSRCWPPMSRCPCRRTRVRSRPYRGSVREECQRHSGVVSGAQLSRLQPQARTAGGAGSVQGTGRVPVRGAQCRAVARAEGFGPRPFVGLL